ncbi:hypothetical protein GCM10020331_050050 [Ectobacillus funiculus]
MDYKAHGEIVDFVVIMTYDWGWQGGPPQAVSPIGPVKQVIQYAKITNASKQNYDGAKIYTALTGRFHLNLAIWPKPSAPLPLLL